MYAVLSAFLMLISYATAFVIIVRAGIHDQLFRSFFDPDDRGDVLKFTAAL